MLHPEAPFLEEQAPKASELHDDHVVHWLLVLALLRMVPRDAASFPV
jgi:hypothetical protein